MIFKDYLYSRLVHLNRRVCQEFPTEEIPEKYRSAAVLIPLWPETDGTVKIAFTQRTESLPSHKGQMSFPGGSMLHDDHNTEFTALRETREELGIHPERVNIMGRMDDAWSRYGFHIIPYVGWMQEKPEFKPDYNEVADILVADLETLMLPECSCIHEFTIDGVNRKSQAFRWEDGYVWGVTADILLELILWIKGKESNRRDIRLKSFRSFLLKSEE
ncbi:MAG: 8-oxo-dGTP pyrophosphatase MutT (NUDIX family) [Gammaproteobacteria bacterium]|jgi:8-oxo-dGTP pyrophosphatase MutT (NUDIX family)